MDARADAERPKGVAFALVVVGMLAAFAMDALPGDAHGHGDHVLSMLPHQLLSAAPVALILVLLTGARQPRDLYLGVAMSVLGVAMGDALLLAA